MEPKNASRHNTARTSAVCHQIVRKSAIFSNSHCQSTGNRASSAMTAYKPAMTAPKAIIILRNVNRHAQASSTDPRMIAKAKMEAPDAKAPIHPISAISPKIMKMPPHITTSRAQSRPTTNRKRYRPTTCAVRETGISPRMALCPCRFLGCSRPQCTHTCHHRCQTSESAHQTTGNVFIDMGRYHHQRYHDRQHRENQQKHHIRHAEQTRPDTIESTLLYYGFPAHRHHSLEANMREAITYEIPYATTVVVNTAITSHNRCAMMAFAAWANPLVTEAGKIDSSMDPANTTT